MGCVTTTLELATSSRLCPVLAQRQLGNGCSDVLIGDGRPARYGEVSREVIDRYLTSYGVAPAEG